MTFGYHTSTIHANCPNVNIRRGKPAWCSNWNSRCRMYSTTWAMQTRFFASSRSSPSSLLLSHRSRAQDKRQPQGTQGTELFLLAQELRSSPAE